LDDLWVIAQLNNFIPDIETHDSKLSLSFSVDFEVREGHCLTGIAHLDAHLFAAHYLVSFEVVVLFHPKFAEVLHLTVQVDRMGEELVFRT
jgi:hypothetical protein